MELDARGRRLRAALAAVLVKAEAPELRLMHEWLDSWSGIGLIVVGMTWQGWDLQLTAYAGRDPRSSSCGLMGGYPRGEGWFGRGAITVDCTREKYPLFGALTEFDLRADYATQIRRERRAAGS